MADKALHREVFLHKSDRYKVFLSAFTLLGTSLLILLVFVKDHDIQCLLLWIMIFVVGLVWVVYFNIYNMLQILDIYQDHIMIKSPKMSYLTMFIFLLSRKLILPMDKILIACPNIFHQNGTIAIRGKIYRGVEIFENLDMIEKKAPAVVTVRLKRNKFDIKKKDLIRLSRSYQKEYIEITNSMTRLGSVKNKIGTFGKKNYMQHFQFYIESDLLLICDPQYLHQPGVFSPPGRYKNADIIPLHTSKPDKVLKIIQERIN